MRIIFVGIHNKPNMQPLDSRTKSGKLIDKAIEKLKTVNGIGNTEFVKCNLFDALSVPDDIFERGEMKIAFFDRIKLAKGDILILLGRNVAAEFPYYIKLFSIPVKNPVFKVNHPASVFGKDAEDKYVKEIFDHVDSVINFQFAA